MDTQPPHTTAQSIDEIVASAIKPVLELISLGDFTFRTISKQRIEGKYMRIFLEDCGWVGSVVSFVDGELSGIHQRLVVRDSLNYLRITKKATKIYGIVPACHPFNEHGQRLIHPYVPYLDVDQKSQ